MGHILSQVPHTPANKAIIRCFKQEATKKDNLKHLSYLLPDKNLKRLSVKNNANISDLVVQSCGKSVYVCVCVCGGGGIWCVSVLVERAVSIYIYKNILIISLASRCKAFPPPQVGFDNCFLILVLNLVIKKRS